jgi:hypothetical protein
VSDTRERQLERRASNGDPDAAHELHRSRLTRSCLDGGLSHELLAPRRLTFTGDDGTLHTYERISTCTRCKAEVPWHRVKALRWTAASMPPAPELRDFLRRNEGGELIAHVRTSPLEAPKSS